MKLLCGSSFTFTYKLEYKECTICGEKLAEKVIPALPEDSASEDSSASDSESDSSEDSSSEDSSSSDSEFDGSEDCSSENSSSSNSESKEPENDEKNSSESESSSTILMGCFGTAASGVSLSILISLAIGMYVMKSRKEE